MRSTDNIFNEICTEALEPTDEELNAAIPPDETEQASGWQPIETAPKDGQTILVFDGGHVVTVAWRHDDCWGGVWGTEGYIRDGSIYDEPLIAYYPTHWMPLPKPPEASSAVSSDTPESSLQHPEREKHDGKV